MSEVNFDNVKITSEFTSEVGTLTSGETLGELFGKTAGHISNGGNPHNVTAAQVGAYTKDEADALIPTTLPANGGDSDTVGGYTPAQLLNISPNLLINPDFSINQRGQTTYTGASVYTADKWKTNGDSKTQVTISDAGIKLGFTDGSSPTGKASIIQTLENPVTGKVAISFKVAEAGAPEKLSCTLQYYSGGKTVTSNSASRVYESDHVYSFTRTIPDGATSVAIILCGANAAESSSSADSYTVFEWVKLEVGSISTSFSPPDPATELVKCRRYYLGEYRNHSLLGYPLSANVWFVPLPASMKPDVSPWYRGTFSVVKFDDSGGTTTLLESTQYLSPSRWGTNGIIVTNASGTTLTEEGILVAEGGFCAE